MTVSYHRYVNGEWDQGITARLPGNITGSDINGIAVQNDIIYLLVETFNPLVGTQWTIQIQVGLDDFVTLTTLPRSIIQPRGLVVCENGDAYVVDRATKKYYHYYANQDSWDRAGVALATDITDPQGLAIDLMGSAYVVDAGTLAYYKQLNGVWQEGVPLIRNVNPGGIALDENNLVWVQDINTGLLSSHDQETDIWTQGLDTVAAASVKGIAIDIPAPCIDENTIDLSVNFDCTGSLSGEMTATLEVGVDDFPGDDMTGPVVDDGCNIFERQENGGPWRRIGSIFEIFGLVRDVFGEIVDCILDRDNLPWILALIAGAWFLIRLSKDGEDRKALPAGVTDPKNMAIAPNGDQLVLDMATRKIYRCHNDAWDGGIDFPRDHLFATGLSEDNVISFYGSRETYRRQGTFYSRGPMLPSIEGILDRGPQGIDNDYLVSGGSPARVYRNIQSTWQFFATAPTEATHVTGVSGDYLLDRDTRSIYIRSGTTYMHDRDLPSSLIFPTGISVVSGVIRISDNSTHAIFITPIDGSEWQAEPYPPHVINAHGVAANSLVDNFTGRHYARVGDGWDAGLFLPDVSIDVCGLAVGPDNSPVTLDPVGGRIWRYFDGRWTVAVQLPANVINPTSISVAGNGDFIVTAEGKQYRYTGFGWGQGDDLPPGIVPTGVFPIASSKKPLYTSIEFEDDTLTGDLSASLEVGESPTLEISVAFTNNTLTGSLSPNLEVLNEDEISTLFTITDLQDVKRRYFSVEFLFIDTGHARLTSWAEDRTINGSTYEATGTALDVTTPAETLDIVARECVVTLGQLTQNSIARLYAENFTGSPVNVYYSTENAISTQVYHELVFSGVWDHHTLSLSDDGYTVSIRVSSRLNTLRTSDPERYTDAQHKALYPEDRFFEFVNDQVGRRLN